MPRHPLTPHGHVTADLPQAQRQTGAGAAYPPAPPLDHPGCYLALAARDARFDGQFFTGVTSTGIYCRPICRVRTPRASNCVFFRLAAQAERAGFRPCLRCRPEMAPHAFRWSSQDATHVLLQQACQLLAQAPVASAEVGVTMASVAARLGVSDRHVRRIFQVHLGVSPLQYLQTQRLLTAKQLLADTHLPISEVAWLSGFSSLRRFNACLQTHYGLTPSAMRKHGAQTSATFTRVKLAYRPPFSVDAFLQFAAMRAIQGVETVDVAARSITRTLRIQRTAAATNIPSPTGSAARDVVGWITVRLPTDQAWADVEVSAELCHALPTVIRRVRDWLDLDADPAAVDHTLGSDFPAALGLRVPGTVDSFELCVRAVLGQLVTVQAATTLCQRVAQALGSAVDTPWSTLTHLFPDPAQWLAAAPDQLGAMGVTRQKQQAIGALAQSLLADPLWLSPGADPDATHARLLTLPGVGPWTASYILMRAVHWPDAFPAGDMALQKALNVRQHPRPLNAAGQHAQAWHPWRSYAVMALWQGLCIKSNKIAYSSNK